MKTKMHWKVQFIPTNQTKSNNIPHFVINIENPEKDRFRPGISLPPKKTSYLQKCSLKILCSFLRKVKKIPASPYNLTPLIKGSRH